MPISFFHPHEINSFSINKDDKQHQNLLEYIASKEKEFPSDEKAKHNISLVLETKFVRSKSLDGTPVKIDPLNPYAISVKIDTEEKFANTYSWSFKEDLAPKLKERYSDFRFDKKYSKIMKELEKNITYCGERYLDFKRKKGGKKKFYNPNIINEFDKHYNQR